MNTPLSNLQVNGPSMPSIPMWSPPSLNSPVKAKLAAALVKTQLEMGNATKGAKNPFFKSNYADLNSVREAVLPAANANGLVVLQPTVTIDGKDYVRTLVIHESGEEMSADTEIKCAKANDPQAHGSGISYARRYGLQAFFNVGAVDDDGEKAMGRTPPAKAAPVKSDLPAEKSPPVTAPGTESVVAATEKKPSTSFRAKKSPPTESVAKAEPVAKAPATAADENWT